MQAPIVVRAAMHEVAPEQQNCDARAHGQQSDDNQDSASLFPPQIDPLAPHDRVHRFEIPTLLLLPPPQTPAVEREWQASSRCGSLIAQRALVLVEGDGKARGVLWNTGLSLRTHFHQLEG